jgi:porphobilinogen synthase
MSFPDTRLRRTRRTENLRRLVRETELSVNDLVMPFFVVLGSNKRESIPSLKGISRLSVDNLIKDAKKAYSLGIKSALLFGVVGKKDAGGTEAYKKSGVVQQAIRELKKEIPELVIISDVCLCGYTSSGQCFVGDNDKTLKLLARIALSHAEAGADVVAPSAMMDGQVGAVRKDLDGSGFKDTLIMSYSAKYASAFYGPFRDAAGSAPKFGDRKSYQMDPANSSEALREIELDIHEGADIVMVKPALAYLDVISSVKNKFNVPVAAYNVSGEYSMIKAAAEKSLIDEDKVVLETLTGMKRAGANVIITYFAAEVAKLLNG